MRKRAFTLTEIIIAIIVMTVIAAVTLRITKAHTDMIVSYLYYGTYDNLRTVVAQIVANNTNNSTSLDGLGLCDEFKKLVNMSNTLTDTQVCHGTTSISDSTDFANAIPDIVLANGMRIYNVQNVMTDNHYLGLYYRLYVDINAGKNDSVLWEDIFPFIILPNGHVIPEYPRDGTEAGGNSTHYLETSVQYDSYDTNGNRHVSWLEKSIPFNRAACLSGLDSNLNMDGYCRSIPVYQDTTHCTTSDADCRIVVVKPLGSR